MLSLLSDLMSVRWHVAARTFGNNHCTLVGLLVDWWTSLDLNRNTAIESGPTNGYLEQGKRGQCDALFCVDGIPKGVLEVEGTRVISTAKKIGTFFDARYSDLAQLEFAVLLVYSYNPESKGVERSFPRAITPELVDTISEITRSHPGRFIAAIGLDKLYTRQRACIRARNEWYMGTPCRIAGMLFGDGQLLEESVYWELAGAGRSANVDTTSVREA